MASSLHGGGGAAVGRGSAVRDPSPPAPKATGHAHAIGIDLGTSFSRVAVFQNGRPEIIADGAGNRSIPSCVAFTDSETLVGEESFTCYGLT